MQSSTKINANAYVLIGGSSKRFGSPKWAAKLNGVRLIDHTWKICKVFKKRYIIGKSRHNQIKYPFLEDEIVKIQSPLNGIYSALSHSKEKWNFIISCDLPLMSSEMIRKIWTNGNKSADAIVPIIKEQSNPVCAFYNQKAHSNIKKELINKNLKVLDILQLIKTDYVPINDNQKEFANMNTRKDLKGIINKSY